MTSLAPKPQPFKVGLRFDQRDAKLLATIRDRAMRQELGPQAVSLFATAARAASRNEPLELQCDNLDEARQVAEAFPRYGVNAPTIEVTSGLV